MRAISATAISKVDTAGDSVLREPDGFTLIEAIVALAIAAAAVIIIGTGLVRALAVQRLAAEKRNQSILTRMVECGENIPVMGNDLLESGYGKFSFLKSVVEKDNETWVIWEAHSDRPDGVGLSIQFSDRD